MKMKKCVYVFRRDLRLRDNTGLIAAVSQFEEVLPVFIFDSNQVKPEKDNRPVSQNFIQLMVEAVNDLSKYIENQGGRLCCFYGIPFKVLQYIIAEWKPNAVSFNLDYSEYSLERDRSIKTLCEQLNVKLLPYHDITLTKYETAIESFHFSYWEFVKKVGVVKSTTKSFPEKTARLTNKVFPREWKDWNAFHKNNPKITTTTTRSAAIARLRSGEEDFAESRHNIARDGLRISAHLKLGLISPREVVEYTSQKWKKANCVELLKQLLWRDFYITWMAKQNSSSNFSAGKSVIDVNVPTSIYDFIDNRFKNISWLNDPAEIKAMWAGETGVPLIDAAMRELNQTGFMHNRGRLAVGFYSVKILRINPFSEWGGQRYFSKTLIDCDSAVNTGNWHWVSSDKLDASGQRYNSGWSGRPMNPNKATATDPHCEYIKSWIPELIPLSSAEINNWHENHKVLAKRLKKSYPAPIVDFKKRWKEWCDMTK